MDVVANDAYPEPRGWWTPGFIAGPSKRTLMRSLKGGRELDF
jgi:hypothetical protein